MLLNVLGTKNRGPLMATIGTERTGDFTLVGTDAGKIVPINSASQVDVTVPSTVGFRDGTTIDLLMTGTSFFRVLGDGTSTVVPTPGFAVASLTGAGAMATLLLDSGTWYLVGDLSRYALKGFSNVHTALSVRRLLASYTDRSMEIRETGASADENVYFDANGDNDQNSARRHIAGNAGQVQSFDDQSGNSRDFVQATDIDQPTYLPNDQNGRPTASHSGASDNTLERAISGDAIYANAGAAHAMSFVLSGPSGQTAGRFFSESDTASANSRYELSADGGIVEMFIRNSAGSTLLDGGEFSTTVFDNAYHAVMLEDNDGALELFVDNVDNNDTQSYTRGTLTSNISTTGATETSGGVISEGQVKISEMILFSAIPSAGERQALQANQVDYFGL